MATEREYRERQRYRGKTPKKKGSFPVFWFLFGIILGAIFLNKPFFSKFVAKNNLTSLTSTLLDKSLLPSSVVVTQRIDNPIAGNPQTLTLTKTSQLDQLDQQAASINYSGNSVEELAKILTPFATTETEKARLIYAWITQHISYDVQSFLKGNLDGLDLSPSGVLKSRLTICSGYANLYQSLAKAMGLNAVIIEGYGKGPSYGVGTDKDVNHAWNGVKVEGTWYLVDATWGAGAIDNQQFKANFNPYYFGTEPKEFIYSHFPAESQWQLLPTVYTRAEFDNFPDVSARYFRDGLQLLSHTNNSKISANGRLEIRLTAPENIAIAAQLMDASGNKLEPVHSFVQKQDQQAIISVSLPSVGEYQLIIFSKNKDEKIYSQAVKYNIQSLASGEPFPITYGSFTDKNVYLETPLKKTLPINQASYFQLKINEANKVVVVNKDTNNLTELTRSDRFFVGSVEISSGKTIVAAQFPGSDQYWTLLEYN